MPLLYLAKVNLNSNIFDVYKKSLDLHKVLNKIYDQFNMEGEYANQTKEHLQDAYGNRFGFQRESVYSFQEIKKIEDGIITGKLLRRFTKPSEEVDVENNCLKTITIKETVSIYFYYDVYKEMVTFCERQSFGYNQFMGAFTYLLNKIAFPYEFELFLQKDRDVLEEKLRGLISVKNVRATLIPPNANEDDLAELRNELVYMQQCQDANANKVYLEYSSDNMNMESKVMKDIKTAVSRGYGDVNATGINVSGRPQTVRSSQDAAYTANIQDNINEDDFNEESHNLIVRFLGKIAFKVSGKKEESNA